MKSLKKWKFIFIFLLSCLWFELIVCIEEKDVKEKNYITSTKDNVIRKIMNEGYQNWNGALIEEEEEQKSIAFEKLDYFLVAIAASKLRVHQCHEEKLIQYELQKEVIMKNLEEWEEECMRYLRNFSKTYAIFLKYCQENKIFQKIMIEQKFLHETDVQDSKDNICLDESIEFLRSSQNLIQNIAMLPEKKYIVSSSLKKSFRWFHHI